MSIGDRRGAKLCQSLCSPPVGMLLWKCCRFFAALLLVVQFMVPRRGFFSCPPRTKTIGQSRNVARGVIVWQCLTCVQQVSWGRFTTVGGPPFYGTGERNWVKDASQCSRDPAKPDNPPQPGNSSKGRATGPRYWYPYTTKGSHVFPHVRADAAAGSAGCALRCLLQDGSRSVERGPPQGQRPIIPSAQRCHARIHV